MKIVIDTNILLSALIKDSITRKIIVESEWDFYYPKMSLHEIRKYKDLVLGKSGMEEREYEELLTRLLEYVEIIPDENINKHLNEANQILSEIDPDDIVFVATAISIEDSIIWSDDGDFEKQDKIKVLETEDVIDLFFSGKVDKKRSLIRILNFHFSRINFATSTSLLE